MLLPSAIARVASRAVVLLRLCVLLSAATLLGCSNSNDGDGSANNSASPSAPPPTATTGSLALTINGLPVNADGNVVISGPSGPLVAAKTQGFGGLAPGTYQINASSVLTGTAMAAPMQASQSITIAANSTASATVNYAIGSAFTLKLQDVLAPGILAGPMHLDAPPNDVRLFVAERAGRIRIIQNGALLATPFLDISSRVATAGEGGLLSFAFHPSYASNRQFYVHFIDAGGNIVVERFLASTADANVAVNTPMQVISIPHPTYTNHYGGRVAFGADGLLYLSTGDGGGGGDPNRNGQNLNALLGKLLRIDVTNLPYTIPSTNPFAGQAGRRGEIWAYGLRNPFRFAFDNAATLLYVADVGQGDREEINAVATTAAGLNYGWPITEGSLCFPQSASCSRTGLTAPVHDYDHTQGCSVTGGYVYRGSAIPEIVGRYFYSDYCGGWLRSVRYAQGGVVERVDWAIASIGRVLSIGQDGNGELYLLAENGRVARVSK